jgi:hypothetical protein
LSGFAITVIQAVKALTVTAHLAISAIVIGSTRRQARIFGRARVTLNAGIERNARPAGWAHGRWCLDTAKEQGEAKDRDEAKGTNALHGKSTACDG